MSRLLSMSDAEVAALSEDEIAAIQAEDDTVVLTPDDVDDNDPANGMPEVQAEEQVEEVVEEQDPPAEGAEAEAQPEAEAAEGEEPTEAESGEPKAEGEVDTEPAAGNGPAEGEGKPDGEDEPDTGSDKAKPYDYRKQVERILSPIKANGRNIQVNTVDDAIQLMQMGANYHKKMEGLKPGLATLKLLEQHGLLDQEKLSHLIDLSKGDVNAINRLVKDKGIDTLAIDAEKADQYKVGTYNVNTKAVELDNVLQDLQDSPKYADMLNVVGKQWDNASQKALEDNPEHLRAITAHMESGIYEAVEDRVFTERALGRLRGLSDFDAYRTVGEQMHKEGKFNAQPTEVKSTAKPAPKVTKVIPATKTVNEAAKKDQKRAASSSVKQAVTKPVTDYNPLSMSDEEFIKHSQANFNTF